MAHFSATCLRTHLQCPCGHIVLTQKWCDPAWWVGCSISRLPQSRLCCSSAHSNPAWFGFCGVTPARIRPVSGSSVQYLLTGRYKGTALFCQNFSSSIFASGRKPLSCLSSAITKPGVFRSCPGALPNPTKPLPSKLSNKWTTSLTFKVSVFGWFIKVNIQDASESASLLRQRK